MKQTAIREGVRKTPVRAHADVIVAGGGPAGIGAALGAARAGARTVLVERNGCVGGMLTAGSVLNIRQYTDDQRQIVGGAAAELALRIAAAGGTEQTPDKGRCVTHDLEITKFVAQEMLLEAGVDLLLHTSIVGAVTPDNALQGLLVENKGGRSALLASATADCTGDGDVIAHAGAAFDKRSADEVQPMTLAFIVGGVTAWPGTFYTAENKAIIQKAMDAGTFPCSRTPALFTLLHEGWMYANATRIPGDCTDPADLTRGEIEGRRQAFALLEWLRRNIAGYEQAFIVSTAADVGLRESRRLKGLYTLTREDVQAYRRSDDDIALCAYGIDVHYPGAGGEMTWLESGRCYGIPYRCLVPEQVDGLVAAGRCLSATADALGSARVMAICLTTGQAAGVAAALAAKSGCAPRQVSAAAIRAELLRQGAILT